MVIQDLWIGSTFNSSNITARTEWCYSWQTHVLLTVLHFSLSSGIATFSKSPETAFTSIQPLLEFALSHIPASQHSRTVLYILGTAGMRLLPKEEQGTIVEVLYERVSQEYPFYLPKDGVQVISGKMEGEGSQQL